MRVGFLGFGLIAGSIARAIRQNPATGGWTHRGLVAPWRRPRPRGR
jgi:prephenate dehydrogenase